MGAISRGTDANHQNLSLAQKTQKMVALSLGAGYIPLLIVPLSPCEVRIMRGVGGFVVFIGIIVVINVLSQVFGWGVIVY